MSATDDAMLWLKNTFGTRIDAGIAGTPFSRNLIIAIAMQETSYIWMRVYKTQTIDRVLSVCVGDTLDRAKLMRADLEAMPQGKAMFQVARQALVDVGTVDATLKKVAEKHPDKFCHGFGMFQYDIQFFAEDPDYFLTRKWATFDGTLGKCVSELKTKLKKVYGSNKTSLTHDESVYVAIAYNHGSANLNKDFKQGYEDSDGVYYGEHIDTFLTRAEAIL